MNKNELMQKFLTRDINVRASTETSIVDAEKRILRTVLATENPTIVWDRKRRQIVREVLLCGTNNIELNQKRQVPLIESHFVWDVKSSLKGSIRELQSGGNELIGMSHFADSAMDEFKLARDGHLTDVSVGYRTYEKHTVAVLPNTSMQVEGRNFDNNFGDDLLLLVRTKWTPYEGSLVVIGADEFANFRSMEQQQEKGLTAEEVERLLQERNQALEDNIFNKIKGAVRMGEENNNSNPDQKPNLVEMERERITKIQEYGKRFATKLKVDSDKLINDAINSNMSIDQFRAKVLDNLDTSGNVETPTSTIGASEKEVQDFSITRAIQGVLLGWDKAGAGHEREMVKAAAEAIGESPRDERAFFLPAEVLNRRDMPNLGDGKRALTVGSNSAGGYLKGTEHLGASFIEMFRAKSVLKRAGVSQLTGLRGDIEIPKQLSAGTLAFGPEGTNPSQSFLTLGNVTGQPHEGRSTTEYSRKLLLQSDPSIDLLVKNDLTRIAALGADKVGLHGDGNYEPLGLASVSGVGGVDLSSHTWDKIVEFESDIENANADVGDLSFIINPTIKGKWKTTAKHSSGNQGYLMSERGEVNGYNSFVTTNVESGFVFFGMWQMLQMLEWGRWEILVNPYGANSRAGNVEVSIFIAIDWICRQAGAFSVSDNAA